MFIPPYWTSIRLKRKLAVSYSSAVIILFGSATDHMKQFSVASAKKRVIAN